MRRRARASLLPHSAHAVVTFDNFVSRRGRCHSGAANAARSVAAGPVLPWPDDSAVPARRGPPLPFRIGMTYTPGLPAAGTATAATTGTAARRR